MSPEEQAISKLRAAPYAVGEEQIFALEEFFRRNQEPTEIPSIFALRYISDVRTVGPDLWVLLNTGDENPGVMVILSSGGAKRRRVELPTVQGAGAFAVDSDRERLYLTVPSAAAVMVVEMEEG